MSEYTATLQKKSPARLIEIEAILCIFALYLSRYCFQNCPTMPSSLLLLLANILITSFLNGLVWFVQIVHYPSFRYTTAQFSAFHHFHTARTSLITAFPMLIELLLAFALLWEYQAQRNWLSIFALSAFLLALAVWVNTFFFAIPLHVKLGEGFQEAIHAKLLQVNFWRSLLWTARLAALVGCALLLWKQHQAN